MLLHLDMDAFYASIEQMDNPQYRGKPVIIGQGMRGVVSTASYEARSYGIHSAMPVLMAQKLCPNGIFLVGRMSRYVEISRSIMQALSEFSPIIEQASIDEAYVDITGLEKIFGSVEKIIAKIKARIRQVSGGLTCSIGVNNVKFLAKMCSDVNKPDGVFILEDDKVDAFLLPLAVQKLPGVGKKTLDILNKLGIETIAQLREHSLEFFKAKFGKWGVDLYDSAFGRGSTQLTPCHERKSESAEITLDRDTFDRDFLLNILFEHAERIGSRLRKQKIKGRTVTLKIKFSDFKQITRSITFNEATNNTQTIFEEGAKLFMALNFKKAIRLIGLGVSSFNNKNISSQLVLPFLHSVDESENKRQEKLEKLDGVIDNLRLKFGKDIVQRRRSLNNEDI